MNKLRLLGSEFKHSRVFIVVATLQMIISMFLLNMGLTMMYTANASSMYYSSSVADYSCVSVYGGSYRGGNTAGELKGVVGDLSEFATVACFGEVERKRLNDLNEWEIYYSGAVSVITPSLLENFDNLGYKKSMGKTDEYYEAYVHKNNDYELNKVYDVPFAGTDGIVRTLSIKPVAYFNESDYYYNFSSSISTPVSNVSSGEILICDDVENFEYAEIGSGIFVTEQPPSHYEDLGFVSMTVQQLYDSNRAMQKELGALPLYLSIVMILFTCVSILCMYNINVSKTIRKRTVNYICGVSAKTQLVMELSKMSMIFLISFFVNLAPSIILGSDFMYRKIDMIWLSVPNLFISTAVMLGTYLLSIAIGLVKYVKADTVKIINNQH